MSDRARTSRKVFQRWAWRIGRIVIVAYVGLAIVLALLQNQLIFPGAATQGRAEAVVDPARFAGGAELIRLKTATGDTVAALFGPALDRAGRPHPDAANRPTILHFYGNGMCLADCAVEFANFRRRGFNVMVAEYIGYGMSSGAPSEQGVYATADACFDHLLSRRDIDPRRIVPSGWSLGAAAAFHLAATRPPQQVPCVVAVSAFTSLDAMARRLFPYLPTSLVLRHHFDNEQKIRTIRQPVFLGHGTRDQIIPFEMSGQLAAAAAAAAAAAPTGKIVKYDILDADHNDVFDIGGTGLLDAIENFINHHAAAEQSSD